MGKSGYRKFMKKERARVKMKDKAKTLLPKGQNVTDLNFKVKKIVIKSQLKEHEVNEILSSRKLNIQEVLGRLGHYSGSVSTEAVGQLESLLKQGGHSFLSSHLSQIVTQLAKLLTSPHSHLRKAAIKLLTSVLSQVNEAEWIVIRGVVISYIVCGLSHVDPVIRSDSLLALDACPNAAVCVDTLLPPLLDVMSTSCPAGSRSLNTPLASSPAVHRTAVLSRIKSVLSSLQIPETVKADEVDDVAWTEHMRVPLIPSYPLNDPLSIESHIPAASVVHGFNIKDFTSSLIPLMMDSFSEISPAVDKHEPVCVLNEDAFKLLSTLADVLLLLYDLLGKQDSVHNNIWMKNKFGNHFEKRLIAGRFPYGVESSRKRGKAGHSSTLNTDKLNLSLALLALYLIPPSSWKTVLQYLSDILRSNATVEEINLLGRCMLACLSHSNTKATSKLLSALVKVNRSSPFYAQAFSVLSNLSLNGTSEKELTQWLEGLIADLASPDLPIHSDVLDFLKKAAPVTVLPSNYDQAVLCILEKALKSDSNDHLFSAGSLIYWIKDWNSNILEKLTFLIQSHSRQQNINSHIKNLILHKSQRHPELDLILKTQPTFL